jgi:ABC-2 type transport system ATP-binding protein
MTRAIEVRDVGVTLGGRPVLDGLSFTVPAGQVTGLLGPSGCGKTTLMRCVVGVQRIDRGEVRVLGMPAGSPPLRRRVGYVTQTPSVYGDLSARDNARYFAALYGTSRAAADRTLAEVGLADRAAQMVSTLSGGERARVSLACALLAAPELLVLDEPTVGLDPLLRQDMWARFHALAAAGTTLFVSSHVMDEAGRCDRLLLMRDGVLVADDAPDAVRAATGTADLEEAFLR